MVGIYIITNKVNCKNYIGLSRCIEYRFEEHKKGIRSNKHLQNSMKKYGIENFEFKVLEECNDLNILGERERYWISVYKSNDPRYGYNKTDGGEDSFRFNEEMHRHLSEHHADVNGEKNPAYGKKIIHNDSDIIRVLPENLQFYLEDGWELGFPEISREKLSKSITANGNPIYGKNRISKDGKIKYVTDEEVEIYRLDGWIIGLTDEEKQKRSEKYTGTIMVNNGSRNKMIHQEELGKYLSDGWVVGQYFDLGSKERLIDAVKNSPNKSWIHKEDGETKRVSPDEVEHYISLGWIAGRPYKPRKPRKKSV